MMQLIVFLFGLIFLGSVADANCLSQFNMHKAGLIETYLRIIHDGATIESTKLETCVRDARICGEVVEKRPGCEVKIREDRHDYAYAEELCGGKVVLKMTWKRLDHSQIQVDIDSRFKDGLLISSTQKRTGECK